MRAFIVGMIGEVTVEMKAGTIDADLTTLRAVAVAGFVGALAVLSAWLDPTDPRYGLGA